MSARADRPRLAALRQPGVTAPIVGVSKPEQLEQAIGALDVTLTDEDARRLEEPYVPHHGFDVNAITSPAPSSGLRPALFSGSHCATFDRSPELLATLSARAVGHAGRGRRRKHRPGHRHEDPAAGRRHERDRRCAAAVVGRTGCRRCTR